jgi:hypothetical protein
MVFSDKRESAMKAVFFAFIIACVPVSSAFAQMTTQRHYEICMKRKHALCAERVQYAKKYGYWINARGEQKPTRN